MAHNPNPGDEKVGDTTDVQPYLTNFLVTDDMPEDDVKNMLKKAFPLLKADNEFLADLGRIGSFMTHKDRVKTALIPLNNYLADQIKTKNHAAAQEYNKFLQNPEIRTTNVHGEPVVFKTHKLLSGALNHFETTGGFGTGVLPTDYKLMEKFWISQGMTGFAHSDTWEARGMSAPKGVPVMEGTVGASWNQVILGQGYQVKDPGAGVFHGEYTHRLQWNAIMHANLKLDHKPVEIYKALGSSWVGHNIEKVWMEKNKKTQWWAKQPSKSYYIWQMLFDATPEKGPDGDVSQAAKSNPHLPKSMNYTCPEVLNRDLGGNMRYAMTMNKTDPLFTLKVLNYVRYVKRGLPESKGEAHSVRGRFTNPHPLDPNVKKRITHVLVDGTGKDEAMIIWYVTERI